MLLALIHRIQLAQAAWRRVLVRATGNQVGASVIIGPYCNVARGYARARQGTVMIGDRSRLEQGVLLHPHAGSIRIGRDVFLGPGVVVYGHGGVEIGDDCLIAMHCRILSSNHEIPPPGVGIRSRPDIVAPTKLGRDVWLGAGVTVLAGVTIGDGCVIGAGAVVTADLPANSIAHGVPARVVSSR